MIRVRRPAVLAALLALVTSLVTGLAAPAPAGAAAAGNPYAADRVIVIGVPGLAWTDLSPERTPELWTFAERASIGAMSVRAARSITCILDGWATLGAGNRARYPGAEEPLSPVPVPAVPEAENPGAHPGGAGRVDGESTATGAAGPASLCDLQQLISTVGLVEPVGSVARIAETEGTKRFGAEPGALGQAVGCATVVGREAALAAARPGVDLAVRDGLPPEDRRGDAELTALLSGCPLDLVSLDGLVETADLGPDEPGPRLGDDSVAPVRAAALREVDATIARLASATGGMPGDSLILVQGVSEIDDARPRLHVALASGPGFDPASWLTSASTGRAPYVQLIDVAPTVLRALGVDAPRSMNGQPMRAGGQRPSLGAAVGELERVNTAARAHYRSTGILFWTLVAGVGLVVLLGLLTIGGLPVGGWTVRERRGPVASRLGRRLLRLVALAVAALPVATYLGNAVPWAAAGSPRLALLGGLLLADAAVVTLSVAGPWRRRPVGPPLVLLGVTAATLVGDVLTGSRLELNGLLGYDAIVAGRFTGFGNLTFGLLSVSALLLTAAVATAAGRRADESRRRVVAGAVVAVGGLVTVGLIGVPSLGRDFGGVLAALPGFALLAMLLTAVRVTLPRLVAVLGAAVVAVGALAVLDWLRPPEDRSHLGRFVDQVLGGEAWTVVLRKGQANLDILLGSPLVWTLPAALLAAYWLVRPGGLLRTRHRDDGSRERLDGLAEADAGALRSGLLAVGLSLAIGAAVNDSGSAVPATAAALLVPLLVWLAATPEAGAGAGADPALPADGAPRGRAAAAGDRVTVASRGSTVWNA